MEVDHNERFTKLEAKFEALESRLGTSINQLTNAILQLTNKIDSVRDAVPLKVVGWMFAILVLSIAGIEGIRVAAKYFIIGG